MIRAKIISVGDVFRVTGEVTSITYQGGITGLDVRAFDPAESAPAIFISESGQKESSPTPMIKGQILTFRKPVRNVSIEGPASGSINALVVIQHGARLSCGISDNGAIEKVLIRDYTGDDTNNRVIDLDDDYDLVLIFGITAHSAQDDHGVIAHALRDTEGAFYAWSGNVDHLQGTTASTVFQGKMTGADANKIKLGSDGVQDYGFNFTGDLYRILALKFSSVQS